MHGEVWPWQTPEPSHTCSSDLFVPCLIVLDSVLSASIVGG